MGQEPAILSARFVADQPRLFAYAFAIVRSRSVADDIVQDVYLALTRAGERGEVIADLPGWCRGVARNLALRHWHEHRRLERLPSAELLDRIDQSFEEGDGEADDAILRALAECRKALPAATVGLLDLRYAHDLPMQAIAERSRRSERAVITALAKVRRKLMDCINARLALPGHG